MPLQLAGDVSRFRRNGISANLLTNGYPGTSRTIPRTHFGGLGGKPFLHHVGTECVLYMVEIEREIGHVGSRGQTPRMTSPVSRRA